MRSRAGGVLALFPQLAERAGLSLESWTPKALLVTSVAVPLTPAHSFLPCLQVLPTSWL